VNRRGREGIERRREEGEEIGRRGCQRSEYGLCLENIVNC